ncbi:MAG: zinc ribbon domain-containing protein [Clostridia bacterium]|nr:zinc ribbon domain-containing protein [Clostridia bacterium]
MLSIIYSYKERLCSYNDAYTIKYFLETNDTSGIINNAVHTLNTREKIANKASSQSKATKVNWNTTFKQCKQCGDVMVYHAKGKYGPYYSCSRCKKNVAAKEEQ